MIGRKMHRFHSGAVSLRQDGKLTTLNFLYRYLKKYRWPICMRDCVRYRMKL